MAVFKKTLPQQLLEFFRAHEGEVINGAQISRMLFPKYAYGRIKEGAFHSPKAISRRLQELAAEGTLKVSYAHNQAFYTLSERPKKQTITYIEKDGQRFARITYA